MPPDKPDSAEAHNDLGTALRRQGRLDEAAASYRRALEAKADFAKAHGNLAGVLRLQGRTSEAEASCRRAVDLDPRLVPALVLLSELQADQGQFDAALASLEHAIAVEPRSPQAWAGLARWRTMTGSDRAWLVQAQQMADGGLPRQQEVLLRYAIGKYFADVQAFDQAFASYHRANELERLGKHKHDRQLLARAVDILIRTYDRAWLTRTRNEASDSQRPVFIIGMPRSGTTLVEQILASHPAAFGAGELPFWETALHAHEAAVLHAQTSNATLLRLAKEYLHLLETLEPGAQRVIDKMPGNFMFLGWIRAALPHARIIHMRRDPIDTCLSIYFQHFETAPAYTNDLEDLAHYYTEYSRLMTHWRTILPAGAMLEVPYEELVADQEGWSRRLLEFIGLPWDARCIDFHRTARTIVTASKWQVRQKISKTSVGRWHSYADFIGPLHRLASLE
jgi:tetratricopeptide (TPR) repeat protein